MSKLKMKSQKLKKVFPPKYIIFHLDNNSFQISKFYMAFKDDNSNYMQMLEKGIELKKYHTQKSCAPVLTCTLTFFSK